MLLLLLLLLLLLVVRGYHGKCRHYCCFHHGMLTTELSHNCLCYFHCA